MNAECRTPKYYYVSLTHFIIHHSKFGVRYSFKVFSELIVALPNSTILYKIISSAGMPNQCACHEFLILPCSNHDIECPIPQPGHHLIPINFNGHNEYCPCVAGSVKANAINAAVQKRSSKYFLKKILINSVCFVCKQ